MATSNLIGKNGRLGNQLFQLAAAYAHSLRVGEPCWINPSNAPDLLKLYPDLQDRGVRFTRFAYPTEKFKEPNDHAPPPLRPCLDFEGYFQSEDYFRDHRESVRELFKIDGVKTQNGTGGLHIRLTDYSTGWGKNFYAQLTAKYYANAITRIELETGALNWQVFTDDATGAKRLLSFDPELAARVEYIPPASTVEDFKAMVSCAHFVTANSSFSWWGAYLIPNPAKLVVMPQAWLKNATVKVDDIYFDGAIVLKTDLI